MGKRTKRVTKRTRYAAWVRENVPDVREVNAFLKDMHREVQRHVSRLNKRVDEVRKWFVRYEEPYCEVSQDHRNFFVQMRLPDVHKKDLVLKIAGNKVEVKGFKKERREGRTSLVGFYRSIDVPAQVAADRARAVFRRDTLKVRIPKRTALGVV